MERKHPRKEFKDCISWFWFRYQEIFEDTYDDIECKIKPYADRGVTQLILFSNTHARLSYEPYHRQINDCIGRIVKACHKFGIKVTEHHSSCLYRIMTADEQISLLKEFQRGVPANWEIWSKQKQETSRDWFQKDRFGNNYVTGYHCYAACFNNEEYRKYYFNYLEDLYKQGLDGIMTDDVQYMSWNLETCFCEDCKKKYKEKFGCELPDAEHWDQWFGDMTDQSFIKWLKNRFDSSLSFHQKVLKHYHSLGLELFRPNYCSWRLGTNQTAYCLDELPALDLVFMECCHNNIIRYSWLWWMTEFMHRTMLSEKRDKPKMMQTYVATENALHLGFAMAHTSGALYSNACAFLKEPLNEKPLRDFEHKYADFVYELKHIGGIGVLDSLDNHYYGAGYDFSRVEYWLESALYNSIPIGLVDTKTPSMWNKFKCLCLLDLHMLSNQELAQLMEYTENGGTLLIAGKTAEEDENARFRTPDEIRNIFGLHPVEDMGDLEVKTIPKGKGKLIFVGPLFGFGTDPEKARKVLLDNPERLRYGTIPSYIPSVKSISTPFTNGTDAQKIPWKMPNDTFSGMKKLAEFLQSLLGDDCFKADGLPEGLVSTAWRTVNGEIVINLMNAVETFDIKEGTMISHADTVPFPKLSGTATFTVPGTVSKARFAGLDGEECELQIKGNAITFPLDKLGEFGIIICEQ